MPNTKKASKEGLDNLRILLEAYEYKKGQTCWINHDYYKLDSVVEAFKDIQIRKSLGAMTKADELLLSLICFSFRIG